MARAAAAVALAAALPFARPVLAQVRGEAPAGTEALLHNAQLQYCPLSCEYAGTDSAAWTTYHNFDELALCKDTVLFTFNVLGSTSSPLIKACNTQAKGPRMHAGAFYGLINNNATTDPSPELIRELITPDVVGIASLDGLCGATPQEATVDVETRWSGQGTSSSSNFSAVLSELENYFRNMAGCGKSMMFARSGDSVVGAYAGGDLTKSTAADLVAGVSQSIEGTVPGQYAVQACSAEATFDTRFGLFADLRGNTTSVQTFLANYVRKAGECIELDLESGESPARTPVQILGSSFTSDNNTASNSTMPKRWGKVKPRAQCRDIQVGQGDGCASLATRCGISGSDFMKFNPQSDLCSTLMPKQYVCCSEGDLADHTPQPDADGFCFTYTTQKGDGCWAIADKFGITQQRIEDNNNRTYGFAGCDQLEELQIICLSDGEPPMPSPDPSALCGPRVLNTTRPANYDDVPGLNPCPLNACCDVWGQCGVTEEFCTPSEINGHPGTHKPNTNGCISNCGTGIVNNNDPPAQFARVGYFEAFNRERECLNMDITQFDLNTYTHIHFAFATLSTDFRVVMTDAVKEQFDKMVKMDTKGVKKILSFGGWAFSTEPATSAIFGQAVSAANRNTFATNVAKFLTDNNLDGLDFDWEYPGATDIDGAVQGTAEDGKNYVKFLSILKSKLPAGKTVSIALPGSYWYLRGFPISLMSQVVDYFIFMTYDLHGQWDFGSKWAMPGCTGDSCLRSHVNMTETRTSLSMVTKAGARANQVMMGVSSYGRSFKMADPSCTGPQCGFTGTRLESNAEKGVCTGTAGYISDAEIHNLIYADEFDDAGSVTQWFDGDSQSDMMTWGDGNWVAWMESATKLNRIEWAQGLNFGGTTDWAVDLQSWQKSVDDGDGEIIEGTIADCSLEFNNLDHVVQFASANLFPGYCSSIYLLRAMDTMLEDTINQYYDINNNYDGKFGYYAEYISDLVNPQLANWMDNWGTDAETKKGYGNKYFDCKYKRSDGDSYRYQGACPVPKDIMSNSTWDDPETGYESWIIEYTLRDKTGFETALGEDLGMDPAWVIFEDWDGYPECEGSPGDCVEVHQWHKSFPRRAAEIKVQDPKEIWEQALKDMDRLRDKFSMAIMSVGLNLYDPEYNNEDAAIALAVPVQMLAQAAQHMADIKEIGTEIEEKKKKELILLIVSVVLMVVPFLSEVGFSVAGMAAMARFAFISGEIANGALSIAEIIDDPKSAPMAIMGMVMGVAGAKLKGEEAFSEASQARKLMDLDAVNSVGKTFREIDDKVQIALKSCRG